jgi:hypothetical protein
MGSSACWVGPYLLCLYSLTQPLWFTYLVVVTPQQAESLSTLALSVGLQIMNLMPPPE